MLSPLSNVLALCRRMMAKGHWITSRFDALPRQNSFCFDCNLIDVQFEECWALDSHAQDMCRQGELHIKICGAWSLGISFRNLPALWKPAGWIALSTSCNSHFQYLWHLCLVVVVLDLIDVLSRQGIVPFNSIRNNGPIHWKSQVTVNKAKQAWCQATPRLDFSRHHLPSPRNELSREAEIAHGFEWQHAANFSLQYSRTNTHTYVHIYIYIYIHLYITQSHKDRYSSLIFITYHSYTLYLFTQCAFWSTTLCNPSCMYSCGGVGPIHKTSQGSNKNI